MNNTQITTTVAPLVAFLAGLLAGKGVFGLDVTTWTTIIGGVVGLGATIWAALRTTNTGIISQAANLPEVKTVLLDASVPGVSAQVASTPNNVTAN